MDKPPFEPDNNPKKIAVAGKKGYGASAAAHLAKQGMQSVMKKKEEKNMKEERQLLTLRQILEGRGRPRKNPDDPKWQKKPAAAAKGNDDHDEEDHGPARPDSPHLNTEPDKHISVQLKVAHDMKDEKGGSDVKFANGKTHFVKHDVAGKVLHALDKLKPADRAKVHDHMAQSHENLMAVHKVL